MVVRTNILLILLAVVCFAELILLTTRWIFGNRIFRFCSIGAFAASTHIIVFTVAVEVFKISAVAASVPAFLIALMVSYTGHYHWTFESSGTHRSQLPKYAMVAVNGLMLNVLVTYTIVDLLDAWYGFALMVVVFGIPVITFTLSRRWVFRP